MRRFVRVVGVLVIAMLIAASFAGRMARVAASDPPAPALRKKGDAGLAEFGAYRTIAEADVTLAKALRDLVGRGGGRLVIPPDAPAGWSPRNRLQDAYDAPGVTVIDDRSGIERRYVPPLGGQASDGIHGASRLIERDAKGNFPWQGTYSTEAIVSRFQGGASSYLDRLARPSIKGADSHLYVVTLRGLFRGQTLNVTGLPDGYGGPSERITIKGLALDGTEPFVVADTVHDHPKGALIYNKNVVNGLTVADAANCDNQSMSLMVEKQLHGAGDTFVVSASLGYQGNMMSAAGDEGGLCYAGDITQDPDAFWGEVSTWDRAARRLVYKPGALHPQKLGTSRPIINRNPTKTLKGTKALVVPPGYAYLRDGAKDLNQPLLVAPDAEGWGESLVGRFVAIDDPTESYAADETLSYGYAGAPGRPLHRWWPITAMEKRADGRWNVYVERTAWWTTRRGGPTLFRFANYSTDAQHETPLACLVAPGAWASDVRDAVAGDRPGAVGVAGANDARSLVVAPSPQERTRFDFEPGDPITQPLGSDVWKPTGVRIRHHQGYPGIIGDASFASYNAGKTQVTAALEVNASAAGTLAEVTRGQKDGKTPYASGLAVHAATDAAVEVRGPVAQAAVDLWQYDGNSKPIQWRTNRGVSRLSVDSGNRDFVFSGGNVDLQDRGAVRQSGLSATSTPAMNLRGIDVAVPPGAKAATIRFDRPEADASYAVVVQGSWFTLDRVSAKRSDGFDVEFSVAAPNGAKFDWQLTR